MHGREMEIHSNNRNYRATSHTSVDDPMEESRRNPAKKQEMSLSLLNLNAIINIICLYLIIDRKSTMKLNYLKMDLEQSKNQQLSTLPKLNAEIIWRSVLK